MGRMNPDCWNLEKLVCRSCAVRQAIIPQSLLEKDQVGVSRKELHTLSPWNDEAVSLRLLRRCSLYEFIIE